MEPSRGGGGVIALGPEPRRNRNNYSIMGFMAASLELQREPI